MNRGERLIKFRDSWFSVKSIEVVGCVDKRVYNFYLSYDSDVEH